MANLYEPPVNWGLASLLLLAGLYSAIRGVRLMARALGRGRALELVRGIRLVILAFVAAVFAVGLLSAERGFVVLGAIVLAEELYETGTLAALVRLGDRGSPG